MHKTTKRKPCTWGSVQTSIMASMYNEGHDASVITRSKRHFGTTLTLIGFTMLRLFLPALKQDRSLKSNEKSRIYWVYLYINICMTIYISPCHTDIYNSLLFFAHFVLILLVCGIPIISGVCSYYKRSMSASIPGDRGQVSLNISAYRWTGQDIILWPLLWASPWVTQWFMLIMGFIDLYGFNQLPWMTAL